MIELRDVESSALNLESKREIKVLSGRIEM
jgi:hypothetical protein